VNCSLIFRQPAAFSRASLLSWVKQRRPFIYPFSFSPGDFMMQQSVTPYVPQQFESGWQQIWEESGLYRTAESENQPSFYCLDFFPYPSGEGLHVGHCRNYVPTDVISRFKRMQGMNVLHPMGWDAFGEPTEQFAIRHGIHPRLTTDENTANFKRQFRLIGTSYDWAREIDSSRPEFYRWTQWFFLKFYRRGLAYRDTNYQWWCPTCATTLSSHEIHGDRCWRGHTGITKRQIPAWYFRITAYADELISGLEEVDWPEPIKTIQRNWIGRSAGSEIDFALPGGDQPISVFTTRADTLFGATFLVLAPEHPAVGQLVTSEQARQVAEYQQATLKLSEIDRTAENRPKTGVFTGGYIQHPLSAEMLPVWIADYVLPTYGTGAVMGVPAHDARDAEFARTYALPVRVVVLPLGDSQIPDGAAYEGPGRLVNSPGFDGLESQAATQAIMETLHTRGLGRAVVRYRMRDWLISRQRYWGTPIPIVYCADCGEVPVPEDELPVLLPEMNDFAPDGSGRSPLARLPEFVHTTCPQCGGPAERETDTLGGFACSSWYFLRFTSPHEQHRPYDPQAVHRWMPVDLYVGGAEHAVLHLLYARFWTKALADEGLLSFREPFARLINQGQLHGPDGYRMSKSRGNVITPDEMVAEYGADALRLYVMFMAPFDYDVDWSNEGIRGTWRFLSRVWELYTSLDLSEIDPVQTDPDLLRALHRTIRDVTERVEDFRFNTMVSALMEFGNELFERRRNGLWQTGSFQAALETFLLLLAPGAPYIAEELWQRTGHPGSVHQQPWPAYNPRLAMEEVIEIPVQVDGRLRDKLQMTPQANREQVETAARDSSGVQAALQGRRVARIVYVPGKIVNIVTE
jgi:leucyl-tRNA synthetase